jgi:hypothetical protein
MPGGTGAEWCRVAGWQHSYCIPGLVSGVCSWGSQAEWHHYALRVGHSSWSLACLMSACEYTGCSASWQQQQQQQQQAGGLHLSPLAPKASLCPRRCACRVDGLAGPFCNITIEHMCPNQCSGHGACHQGFCKCYSGWYGHDCAQRQAGLDMEPGEGRAGLAGCSKCCTQGLMTGARGRGGGRVLSSSGGLAQQHQHVQ